jgi:hypothetical protein
VRDDGGVFVVGDYDAADAFCAAVGVECVLCGCGLVLLRLV